MATARQDFLGAQRRMLAKHGIEAQSRYVDVPSIEGRAHVLDVGEGPEVVMLNGIGTPAAMFAPLMAELGELRLLAVDMPAYGLTDTTDRLADDLRKSAVVFLEEVLDRLGLSRPPILANSLGSTWSSWLALDRPERVAALAHVGCPGVALDTSAPLQMRLLSVRPLGRILTRLQPPSPKQVRQLARMVNEAPIDPELVDLLVATERMPGFRSTFLSSLNTLLRLRGSRPETRLTAEQLRRINHPTVLVWGEDDPFGSPEAGERIAAAIPHAGLHVVKGGHAPWLDDAPRIGEILGPFLREHG